MPFLGYQGLNFHKVGVHTYKTWTQNTSVFINKTGKKKKKTIVIYLPFFLKKTPFVLCIVYAVQPQGNLFF